MVGVRLDGVALPDPSRAGTLDELVDRLRRLKIWAGDPSYGTITDRVNAAWSAAGHPATDLVGRTTVVDCFRPGRRRLNPELVVAVVAALHDDPGYGARWRQALRVIGGQGHAASQVRVQQTLPPDLDDFTGRTGELDRIRAALTGRDPVCVVTGMAGVGKTRLALRAAHGLSRDAVLFASLRGFDPAQPAADPGAVLEGWLRLLGVPGHLIPHQADARAAAFRARVAGTRTLIVLDDAADLDQVTPLLPRTPGCPVLITSRLPLSLGLAVPLDVFSTGEAGDYLHRAAAGVPIGADAGAVARIAGRCGNLPLALALVAGHIADAPGWTLTDHADRLDERRRLDSGVEAALGLSYRHLSGELQRLLRLTALHPGTDFDVSAAAVLTGADPAVTAAQLESLRRDHLLQLQKPSRYTFHDLVRAHAVGRGLDEDSARARRSALTRLFDHYLGAAATAMDTLYPAERHRRPDVPRAGRPQLSDPAYAIQWLDTEGPNLISAAAWPSHAVRLAATLFRYLDGRHADAAELHGRAVAAARAAGEAVEEAHALNNLGYACLGLGQHERAGEHLLRSLDLLRAAGDPAGQARPLSALGIIAGRAGRHDEAAACFRQALTLCRQAGDTFGEARALNNLGDTEARQGRYGPGAEHLRQALDMLRRAGDVEGQANALDTLGLLHTLRGHPEDARESYQQALALFRQIGERDAEATALNGLGEAASVAGDPSDAILRHRQALAIAVDVGDVEEQARARTGLDRANQALEQR